ncbi:MAG: hypothetical protein H6707_06120 [Deltaproteobacteria bacterium]|nr:hypothetical protein [Deltaproteobacteria bacterium]
MRLPLLIYLICLAAYLGTAGNRLRGPSSDNHYVYLAKSLLEGRLSLKGRPPHQNDWALVTELTLADGRKLRGTFLRTGASNRFKTTTGERLVIEPSEIRNRRDIYYVSFPWFPAILMLPLVAIWGMAFNDVIFTAAIAAFNPVLVFFVLRKLVALKLSERSVSEDLWLVGAFAFGTVHFYSAVLGQVWYTAHIIGVSLTALYVLAALDGRHPFWAGLCLGLGFVTRAPIPFSLLLIVGEVIRRHLTVATTPLAEHSTPFSKLRHYVSRIDWRPTLTHLTWAAIPMIAIAGIAFAANYARFDSPTEFGHYYLNVRWAERIQRWGLFNYHFLSRNLAVMLTMLPKIVAQAPYIKISWHGLSLFVTTPIFFYLLWPKRRSPVAPWLALAVLGPLVAHLLYQNSGWVQFGYRFSLDYTVYLIALVAIGGRRIGTLAKTLILIGVAVNTFGALTFGRYWQYYWDGMFPTS